MANKLTVLDESDIAILKEIVARVRNTPVSDRRVGNYEHIDQAPEVYLALAPVGGIPARSGTTPGSANCAIYRLLGTTITALGINRFVYNPVSSAIDAGLYIVVVRDKLGAWWALARTSAAAASITVDDQDAADITYDVVGAGVLNIPDAALLQRGVVDVSDQTFGGTKTFQTSGSTAGAIKLGDLTNGAQTQILQTAVNQHSLLISTSLNLTAEPGSVSYLELRPPSDLLAWPNEDAPILMLYGTYDGGNAAEPCFAVHSGLQEYRGVWVTEAGITYAGGLRVSGALDLTGVDGSGLTGIATLTDGDKGDITVSASGATWTIDILNTESRTIGTLTDPGADRILFWDDSAGSYAYLTLGTGLTITGTTIDASGGSGDVTASANITDHALVRGDGGAKGIQDSGIIVSDTDFMTGVAGIEVNNGGLRLVDAGPVTFDFFFDEAQGSRAITFSLLSASTTVSLGGNFTAGTTAGHDVTLTTTADTNVTLPTSGTLATQAYVAGYAQPLDADLTAIAGLGDPNADRILFWDDSAGSFVYLTVGSGLTITDTTITSSGVTDGDKGDITVSSSGTVWTIDILNTESRTIGTLTDPNADRILFWDDSASSYAYLTVGSGLSITTTTISLAIPDGEVTFAKMQTVSTNILLGNDAAGTAVQEITCTAAARTVLSLDDPGVDGLLYWDDSETSYDHITLGAGLGIATTNLNITIAGICQGRLTTESGVAVSTSSRTSQGTIYFTPYKGNAIALYDGTVWKLHTFSERSLALTVTSGTNYDVWLYDNAGTLTLETTAWTDDTTRATAIALQDGVYVKSGATTRRYLGTIRASGSNVTEDSPTRRYVWNYYNRVQRVMEYTDSTDSWTYGSTTYQSARGQTTSLILVNGVREDSIEVNVNLIVGNAGCQIGIGVNGTGAPTGSTGYTGSVETFSAAQACLKELPRLGMTAYHWIERSLAGGSTFYGDAGDAAYGVSGIRALWKC